MFVSVYLPCDFWAFWPSGKKNKYNWAGWKSLRFLRCHKLHANRWSVNGRRKRCITSSTNIEAASAQDVAIWTCPFLEFKVSPTWASNPSEMRVHAFSCPWDWWFLPLKLGWLGYVWRGLRFDFYILDTSLMVSSPGAWWTWFIRALRPQSSKCRHQ